jgi:hypothetical protein
MDAREELTRLESLLRAAEKNYCGSNDPVKMRAYITERKRLLPQMEAMHAKVMGY